MSVVAARDVSVSIVCVFNDPATRAACLDRSIVAGDDADAPEYVLVDNVDGAFATAGAALNHGASRAGGDYLAFVHQDVYLHSLGALRRAAAVLADDPGIGLVGALGVTAGGQMVGRIRDRVMLLGEPALEPTDVDSLDELLFVVPRRLVQAEPLTEAAELSWHGYAVEYGLRARRLGLRVCALDIPLTHNSLTVNLDRLDLAYRALAASYPEALPLRTPGGTIDAGGRRRPLAGLLTSQRWRYRWLRESIAAHAARRAAAGGSCVLSDIRRDIDDVIAAEAASELLVVNLDRGTVDFADEGDERLELVRRGREVVLTSQRMPELLETIESSPRSLPLLITNLELADLRSLGRRLGSRSRLIGYRSEIGPWLLLGTAAAAAPDQWRSSKARPLGMPALAP